MRKNFEKKLEKLKKFDKSKRSNFDYWFWHWLAYNLVALSYNAWKFKYLFHDIEKPFIKLFCKYETVQKFHRKHNKHHPEWLENKLLKLSELVGYPLEEEINFYVDKYDYKGTIIDWESGHYTKNAATLSAVDEYNKLFGSYINFEEKYPKIAFYCYNEFSKRLMETIKKLEGNE